MKRRIAVVLMVCLSITGLVKAAQDIIDDKVIITGEQKKRIDAQKSPIQHEFNIDEVLTFDMEPVKNIYYYYAALPTNDAFITVPSYKPIDPLTGIIVEDILTGPYVKKFTPPELKKAKTWRLTILDGEGREVKKYSSFKIKSKNGIFWDGRDDKEKMLKVGYPYSTIFEWSSKKAEIDNTGNIVWRDAGLYKQTDIGESFSISALFFLDKEKHTITLTNDKLFNKYDMRSEEEDGVDEHMLNQVAVLIQEYFSDPVVIKVYSKNKEEALEQAEMLKTMLSEKLILDANRFTVQGLVASDNRSFTKIVLGK